MLRNNLALPQSLFDTPPNPRLVALLHLDPPMNQMGVHVVMKHQIPVILILIPQILLHIQILIFLAILYFNHFLSHYLVIIDFFFTVFTLNAYLIVPQNKQTQTHKQTIFPINYQTQPPRAHLAPASHYLYTAFHFLFQFGCQFVLDSPLQAH